MLNIILERILAGGEATVEEALQLNSTCTADELCDAADEVRRRRCGSHLDTCSIINARSGHCSENCKWCAQSRHFNTGVRNYEMVGIDETMRMAAGCVDRGVERFSLVTSGRRVSAREIGTFCDIIRKIRREMPGLRLCASMGLLGREELEALRDAGVTRYHCNLETSSDYFPSLCSTHTHADKLRTMQMAREVGLEVCSGGIIGMGETFAQRLTLVREAVAAGAVSVPVNILSPIPGTPLADTPPLTDEEIVRTVALMRLVAPQAVMRFAGGRARLPQATVERILRGGMNGVMVGDLLTTAGNKVDDDYRMFSRLGFDY